MKTTSGLAAFTIDVVWFAVAYGCHGQYSQAKQVSAGNGSDSNT